MCSFVVFSSDNLSLSDLSKALKKVYHRGPDNNYLAIENGLLWGFNRLSIMDLSSNGNQPFKYDSCELVCNGEIYNYNSFKKLLSQEYIFHSNSDCEVLIPLYLKYGIEIMCKMLDAEFALVLYNSKDNSIMAARDPMGIRPMFYGYTKKDHKISFASEAKALIDYCNDIMPFPPGHYYKDGKFTCYNDLSNTKFINNDNLNTIFTNIRTKLISAVEKRLHADAPIGYLLSGGLDSSLVCSIAQRMIKDPIKTFAIGMDTDPIDLKYAKQATDYLGTDHTEVIINKNDVLKALDEVIYHLETFDITTIRASIGMYLLCKYIHENTTLKVILTGEVSDELFGYKYTDFAPSASEFQKESQKRIKELYMYDVLRADRCISAHALEGRVPFADIDFVNYVMSINPSKKMNTYNKGKYLLRKAFDGQQYLPTSLLYREKAAFSDAVGHSLVDYLKEYAESKYTDSELSLAKKRYKHCTPFTKEALLYRDIFEKYYAGNEKWIKGFWMPNREWPGCNVNDPSARVLSNYGDSGK